MFGIDDLIIGLIAAVVVDIIANIAKALAVKNKDENVDELGDRVIQAEENGIKLEDFETHDEYMKAINEFQVDPERSKEIPLEEKRERGVACLLAGIAEKAGLSETTLSLVVKGMNNNTGFFKEFQSGIEKEVIANPRFLSDLGKFLVDDKVDLDTYSRTVETLTKIIKESHPHVSEDSAADEARGLRK